MKRKGKFGLIRKKSVDFLSRYRWQIINLLILTLITSLFFPSGKSLQFTYQKDDIARETIIAPTTFPILKPDYKLEADLKEAIKSEPALFNRKQEVVESQIQKIKALFILIDNIRKAQTKLSQSAEKVFRLRYESNYQNAVSEFNADSTHLLELKSEFSDQFSFNKDVEYWKIFLWDEDSEKINYSLKKLENEIIRICQEHWSVGIYDIPAKDISSEEILLNQSEVPILVNTSDYIDLESAWEETRNEVNKLFSENNQVLRDISYGIIVEMMLPNLIYDKETTERRREIKANRVPRYQGAVLENERIVEKNTRITDDVLLKLKSLEAAIDRQEGAVGWWRNIIGYSGKIIIIGVILSFFYTFLIIYRKDTFLNPKLVLLISILFTSTIILGYLFYTQLEFSKYLIPITVLAMALTILFDARIGFMGTTTIVILIGLMISDIDFVIVMLFTSSIAMYNVRQLRTRSQIFKTIFSLIGASILAVLAVGLFRNASLISMRADLLYLSIVSVLAPIITYGLIGLFEIGFGVTTDLTLLELLDFNTPLLKRLQQEANGTFNHSVVVGNLAEGCADAIGAHALLCRVGAYYHDIGKLKNPQYFIENQLGGENKHDNVTLSMSTKVIRNHVREGIRLADEYGLPKIVKDFVSTHHGSSRIEYFYRQALAEVEEPSKINENEFRYRGPKPQTKETGILMICESIEAAVRSIKEPDIVKIEDMIDRITKKKIDDGQLDECPLTLDELRRIKGTVDGNTGMLPILKGIFHIRIEYPEEQPKQSQSSEPTS